MVKRIAIVGMGWVARDYMVPALAKHRGTRLVAAVSPKPEDLTDLPPGTATFADLADLLTERASNPDFGVDAAYVATPNHLHRAHAVACLDAGMDVLCEKPLAIQPSDARAILLVSERNDRRLLTAFDQRWHPAHRRMRELIHQGQVGTITQVRIDYGCWLPADWAADNWRVDPARAGGGAVIDLAPHGLDLTEFLTGQTITDLHCYLQTAAHDYAVDDGGVLSARLDGGALLAHTVAYNRPDALPRRRLEVIGTRGALVADNTMGQTAGGSLRFVDAAGGEWETLDFDAREDPFYAQLDGFVELLAGHNLSGRYPADDVRLVTLLHRALQHAAPAEDVRRAHCEAAGPAAEQTLSPCP